MPTRRDIEAIQEQKLHTLLSALCPGNAFYSNRIKAAGIHPATATRDTFLSRMALTTRRDWAADVAANPPYGTNLTYPLPAYTRLCRTSGTQGRPMLWLDTTESWGAMLNNWVRVYTECGVTPQDVICFAFSFGPFLGFWTAFEAGAQLGCMCIPGGGLSSAARVDLIAETKSTVLCCTPTYALHLAEVAAAHPHGEAALTSVSHIVVAGEPGGSVPAVRERLSSAWHGAVVVDHHGMTEIGPVTYSRPGMPDVLHIMEEDYLAEVIDPATTEPLPPGSRGELVLTTLNRIGSPLLRYRTGDLVVLEQPAEAEAFLPGGILGRVDDMVIVRGVNVFPSAIDARVRTIPEIVEYRVHVDDATTMTELRLEIEPAEGADGQALARRLAADLREVFALRMPVTPVPAGTLPRFELKARRWVRQSQTHQTGDTDG